MRTIQVTILLSGFLAGMAVGADPKGPHTFQDTANFPGLGADSINPPVSNAGRPHGPVMDSYPGPGPNTSISDHISILGFISVYARDLVQTRGGEYPDLVPVLEQIRSDVEFLQHEWVRWTQRHPRGLPGETYPFGPVEFDPYYRSLNRHATELRKAEKADGPSLVQTVREVGRDIRNKAQNCRNSADGLGKQVLVTAKTLRGTNEVPGFEVLYAPFALLRQKGEHKRFPTLSSPATHKNIPPGFYAVWLRKNKSTNAHIALDIVTDSSGRFSFEIPVSEDFFAVRR